jgi:hypothetical protein
MPLDFCAPSELKAAVERVNDSFRGENQLTLGARIGLGVEIVRAALNDLDDDAARQEITVVLIEMLRERLYANPAVISLSVVQAARTAGEPLH